MRTLAIATLVPLLLTGCRQVKKIYHDDSSRVLEQPSLTAGRIITENDLEALPEPVQKYLRLTGMVGKPLYLKGEFAFKGGFRMSRNQGWMKVRTLQVNDYETMTRVFYMKARMMGIFTARGRDLYRDGTGNMLIKLTPFITLFDVKGPEMDQSALVTLLNDITLVPTAMLSPKISWEAVDSLTARATVSDHGLTVSGTFIFNEKGEIVDFWSDDRYQTGNDGAKNLRWSTPFSNYQAIGAYTLPLTGSGVWHEKDGLFEYARFTLQDYRLF
ncbi:MAG: DUF6544 family protein [Bacteroidota bacterium]